MYREGNERDAGDWKRALSARPTPSFVFIEEIADVGCKIMHTNQFLAQHPQLHRGDTLCNGASSAAPAPARQLARGATRTAHSAVLISFSSAGKEKRVVGGW